MKKKVIVLADNSYTIRRIVELSFSEIENIEVRSFENGSGLKEKLRQLEPDVVIVDIKLPEINGYEICRFLNETPPLNRSRVFLMKGSFEPMDNEMIKNLKYEDIVTKPFDSNALVGAVMKTLNQEENKVSSEFSDEGPNSFPEDITEIETDARAPEGISFSDIRGDMEIPSSLAKAPPRSPALERDEILPSEEITQGTQPLKDDLLPIESEESIKNPFDEEPLMEEGKAVANEAPAAAAPQVEMESVVPKQGSVNMESASGKILDRFLIEEKEDTSETMLKASLDTTRMVDRDDAKFPLDQKDDDFLAGGKKLDADMPVQKMFSEKDEFFDFIGSDQKQKEEKGPEIFEDNVFAKETFVQKVRPETLSPQAELEKLAKTSQKESKAEPKVEPEISLKEKIDLSGKLEDKLALAIKELLWEIVPPLAEKIIKEEIDKIKTDVNNTGF